MLKFKEKAYTFCIVYEDDKRATLPDIGEVERFVEEELGVKVLSGFTDGRYYIVTFRNVNK
jgi:hypothetical protein